MITVVANPVEVNEEAIKPIRMADVINKTIKGTVEACSDYSQQSTIDTNFHGLLGTARLAFDRHYPLVLSPDHVWLTITQGVAKHIEQNAEDLRSKFVNFEGKEFIEIQRDGFRMGSPENEWEGVFDEFASKIKVFIGDANHDRFVADYSTTGPTELAASRIVLMDAMKAYFDYGMRTCCGIPYVAVEGTPEDWDRLVARTVSFEDIGLGWWIDKILPFLQNFADTVRGNGKESFFTNIFNSGGGSGGPYFDGWLPRLLPYLKDYKNNLSRNHLLDKEVDGKMRSFGGITSDAIPSSLSSVPFVWNYYGTLWNYNFVAGLAGATQDETSHALRPKAAWAIQQVGKKTDQSVSDYYNSKKVNGKPCIY